MITRLIPSSNEALPVLGLGTWQTFDVPVGNAQQNLKIVLTRLHEKGGKLIDSSPMYGRAEQVIGDITDSLENANDFFYATKVWTTGKTEGIKQMENSFSKMKRKTMDLIQIHNLVDWQTQIATLRKWKAEGKIKYLGITHYTDSSHEDLEKIMNSEPIDFVQFNYSIDNRHAEKSLLSRAADLGVATLINRPFGEGRLFKKTKGKLLPSWANDLTVTNWAAFFLKFIISHPSVTCVIPATSSPDHAAENLAALTGPLPDAGLRKKMATFMDSL